MGITLNKNLIIKSLNHYTFLDSSVRDSNYKDNYGKSWYNSLSIYKNCITITTTTHNITKTMTAMLSNGIKCRIGRYNRG